MGGSGHSSTCSAAKHDLPALHGIFRPGRASQPEENPVRVPRKSGVEGGVGGRTCAPTDRQLVVGLNLDDPITRRNTGEKITARVPARRVDLNKDALSAGDKVLLEARAKLARRSAVRAVARVGEDHLGGGLEIIDPLELVLSVMDRERGDDFFIAQGHVAAGYFGVLSQHGYLPPKDFEEGFRTSEPIGGHITPIAGGTMNTGRLGDEGGGVGIALANQVLPGKEKAITYLFTSDGSLQEGSACEALEIASNRRANIVFIPAINAMQLSGTTVKLDPRANHVEKARAAGVRIVDVASLHDFEVLFRALSEAVRLCHQGKGPVFLNPVGEKKPARVVLKDPGAWGIEPEEEVWVPGSVMGKGIRHWEDGIVATIHRDLQGNPLENPVNYHDGNLKKEDVDAILKALELSKEEQAAVDRSRSDEREETFYARVKPNSPTNYEFSWPKTFPVSQSARLVDGEPGKDWVTARKGVNAALAELGKKNADALLAVDMDLGVSTQLGVLAEPLGTRFVQAGIRERAGILAAAGAAWKLAKEHGAANGKQPTTCTATFQAFLQGVGREGLEFADYQQDLWGWNKEGLTTGVALKVISSHNGLNPGKDGVTAHGLHGIDMAYELPRLMRTFIPADANHAIHIIRELFAQADFALYLGPRDTTPVIAHPDKPGEPLFGPDWKWEPVTLVEREEGARAAIVATGPILYRALTAADRLRKNGRKVDIYFVGQVKPFPVREITKILTGYDRVVTLEDGFVGASDSARGLAGLVACCLAQNVQQIASGRGGSLPSLGKIGSRSGQTMSQEPTAIYEQYGLGIDDIVREVESGFK